MSAPRQFIDILLQPGDFYFSNDRNTRIRTLLGSCISLTFWHPRLKLGGMSHFLLPDRREKDLQLTRQLADGRYATDMFWLFRQELRQLNLPASQFQVKIFGGGEMFGAVKKGQSIGEQNILAARKGLAALGLTGCPEHVGGQGHRNLILELWSGDVWVRQVPAQPRQATPD